MELDCLGTSGARQFPDWRPGKARQSGDWRSQANNEATCWTRLSYYLVRDEEARSAIPIMPEPGQPVAHLVLPNRIDAGTPAKLREKCVKAGDGWSIPFFTAIESAPRDMRPGGCLAERPGEFG